MGKRFFIAVCLVLSSVVSYAQGMITVKGTVIDENGDPMQGAGIVQKGNTSRGTITDVNGNYSIKVPSNAYLEFSFISYTSQQQ